MKLYTKPFKNKKLNERWRQIQKESREQARKDMEKILPRKGSLLRQLVDIQMSKSINY